MKVFKYMTALFMTISMCATTSSCSTKTENIEDLIIDQQKDISSIDGSITLNGSNVAFIRASYISILSVANLVIYTRENGVNHQVYLQFNSTPTNGDTIQLATVEGVNIHAANDGNAYRNSYWWSADNSKLEDPTQNIYLATFSGCVIKKGESEDLSSYEFKDFQLSNPEKNYDIKINGNVKARILNSENLE